MDEQLTQGVRKKIYGDRSGITKSSQISPAVRKLLEGKNFGLLATLMPDGSPQITPIWVDVEDNFVLVNTATGRQKPLNINRDPRVAIIVSPTDNPYAYATIRGRVVEVTNEGARSHIDKLANKYLGEDKYPFGPPTEERLIVRIQPERISTLRLE